jgi:hypothetical protein
MDEVFLVKYDNGKFPANTLVKLEAVSNSGDCYLVSRFPNWNDREWLMYYDLYKFVKKGEMSQRWQFDEKYDRIIKDLLNL